MNESTHKGDYPEATATDARRALVDAARMDGTTCQRGAYKARRTIKQPDPDTRPGDTQNVVRLRLRETNTRLVDVAVTSFRDLRDDWSRPSPCEPGEVVLPTDEYDLTDVFVDPNALPGDGGDQQ